MVDAVLHGVNRCILGSGASGPRRWLATAAHRAAPGREGRADLVGGATRQPVRAVPIGDAAARRRR